MNPTPYSPLFWIRTMKQLSVSRRFYSLGYAIANFDPKSNRIQPDARRRIFEAPHNARFILGKNYEAMQADARIAEWLRISDFATLEAGHIDCNAYWSGQNAGRNDAEKGLTFRTRPPQ